ncbi:MAG: LysE family transporter [Dehalococcoidia bacterium]
METTLGVFLLSAAAISLTGVMLPGPLTTAVIAKGYDNKHAGALIGAGHGILEIPLIIAIYLGLWQVIGSPRVLQGIYVAGGLMLLYLGIRMFRATGRGSYAAAGLPSGALATGVVVTATNPSFYAWWATVGIALIAVASEFGHRGVLLLMLVHVPLDVIWNEFLSVGTYESRRWWTPRTQRIVFSVCSIAMIGFGVWFVANAFL